MEIDITSFFENANAFEFSASRAERGQNAGPETWANANAEATESPLLTTPEQIAALKRYFRELGAWSREEIAAWDATKCNALFIQYVAGDMREGGLDNDPDENDWAKYERGAEDGRHNGNIYRSDDRIFYSLSH